MYRCVAYQSLPHHPPPPRGHVWKGKGKAKSNAKSWSSRVGLQFPAMKPWCNNIQHSILEPPESGKMVTYKQTNKQTNERTNKRTNERKNKQTNKWMNEQMNEQMNERTNEQMSEWMNKWTNKQMNKQTNKQTNKRLNERTNERTLPLIDLEK